MVGFLAQIIMKVHIAENRKSYSGTEISSLWAYREFDIKEDSIVAFRSPCRIEFEHMIDLEDKKAEAEILSEDMLHFIVEHFDIVNLKLIYTRQRLLAALTGEILEELSMKQITRKGDDLYHNNKKLSISIASLSSVSAKIHFGINVSNRSYGSLEDLDIADKADKLLKTIAGRYAGEIEDIEDDLRKTLPLDVIL